MSDKATHDPFLRVIAVFKILKSLTFFCLGLGLLHFLHQDVEARMQQLMSDLHVDSDNHIARWCTEGAGKVMDFHFHKFNGVEFLSAVAFFYATLFGIEGTGLWLRKRWAEWFVVIITGSLLPLEIYEIFHHFSIAKVALLTGNLLILGYLVYVIRKKK